MERQLSYRPTVTSVFTQASTLPVIAWTVDNRPTNITRSLLLRNSTTEVIGPTPNQCWLIVCDVGQATARYVLFVELNQLFEHQSP